MSAPRNSKIKQTTRLYLYSSWGATVVLTLILSVLFPFKLNFLFFYLVSINSLTLIFYGLDKNLAQASATRIPEKQLLLLGLAGGSLGSLVGIHYLRHKSSKTSYLLKLGLILIVHIILVTGIVYYFY
jgi:uncharacterized membrane protein YsdA (DUF1294 family)